MSYTARATQRNLHRAKIGTYRKLHIAQAIYQVRRELFYAHEGTDDAAAREKQQLFFRDATNPRLDTPFDIAQYKTALCMHFLPGPDL